MNKKHQQNQAIYRATQEIDPDVLKILRFLSQQEKIEEKLRQSKNSSWVEVDISDLTP